jgi:hypothetical protein
MSSRPGHQRCIFVSSYVSHNCSHGAPQLHHPDEHIGRIQLPRNKYGDPQYEHWGMPIRPMFLAPFGSPQSSICHQ